MLWLCIRLPKLPLEAGANGAAATDANTALSRLAVWAQQWSSHVAMHPARTDDEVFGAMSHAALWLEVGGSLALFGGVKGLRAEINAALIMLGYNAELAIAPTPRAAQLLTQAQEPRAVLERPLLAKQLTRLPLHWLALPETDLRALRGAGLRRIGEVLALPPAALARRFGPETSLYIQRLMGDASDPLPATPLPARYHAHCEFSGEVSESTALLFPLQRLLWELQGYLRARDGALQRCQLRLAHYHHADTLITLACSQPTRDATQLLTLAREQLANLTLPAVVRELHLEADEFCAPSVLQGDFFTRDSESAQQLHQILDRLRARLGPDSIQGLTIFPDHRPEHAWRAGNAVVPWAGAFKHFDSLPDTRSVKMLEYPDPETSTLPARPCWLLKVPENIAMPAEVLAGPERIESGWWDHGDVARDYYLARGADGSRQWIFQDLRNQQWFLQGLWS